MRMVSRFVTIFDSMNATKMFELETDKLGSIVWNNFMWRVVDGKYRWFCCGAG